MSFFSTLKRNSKLALRNHWGKAVGIWGICVGVYILLIVLEQLALKMFVPSMYTEFSLQVVPDYSASSFDQIFSMEEMWIMLVFMLLYIVLLQPLVLGMVGWHYRLVHGYGDPVSSVFRFFENGRSFLRALWLSVNISVRSLLWSIPFFAVPVGILWGALHFLLLSENGTERLQAALAMLGMLFFLILIVLASVFYLAYMNKYALAIYLICEDDTRSVRQAIKMSVAYTKGFRFSLMWFGLSFIGWMLLCVIVFPVMLYVGPYLNTAQAMYARYIIEKNRYTQAQPTQEFVPGQEWHIDSNETLHTDHEIDPPPILDAGDSESEEEK